MKNYIFLMLLFLGVQTIQAQSDSTQSDKATTTQSTSDDAQITDEELEKYAVTMDSINDMKQTLLNDITSMVKDNSKITNARYNELSKIIDDEAALTKAKATADEIAFIKEVAVKKEAGTTQIQETFKTMAQDYVGATSYNKIKKALDEDAEVKKRYETQMNKVHGGN